MEQSVYNFVTQFVPNNSCVIWNNMSCEYICSSRQEVAYKAILSLLKCGRWTLGDHCNVTPTLQDKRIQTYTSIF